jgi:3D-(3,5/4)-trihydroxycyclohexane-1,2-dione acylhydrolase (decyclizing)
LHKLWQAGAPGSYHAEYGFSCMGYEIAGGLGAKMAEPEREVVVMVGDGSYLMMNSEIATSVMLGLKLTIVLLDNRGFGCINRLQNATGGASFNNLLPTPATRCCRRSISPPMQADGRDRAKRPARSPSWKRRSREAKQHDRTTVIVIDTDPLVSTEAGGAWWDVAVPEVSERAEVRADEVKL